MSPRFSLIVSTRDRIQSLPDLFDSIEYQDYRNFEVIVVDQNEDHRVTRVLARLQPTFDLHHVRAASCRGLSVGRNRGRRLARGDFLIFPDDDCWYPPDFISRAESLMRTLHLDLLTGRAADDQGRDVNGRFSQRSHPITRGNVWTSQMEWVTCVSRETFDRLGGFDERLGVGAATPWQSAEGPDFILRALEAGAKCHYVPTWVGHHEAFDTQTPDEAMICKGRAYGRGMGHVLRTHGFGVLTVGYWIARSLTNCAVSLLSGKDQRARFYLHVALGRVEGWLGRKVGKGLAPWGQS